MALHFGESPSEGHYQAILNGQPFFGGNKRWLTDDNRPARVHTLQLGIAVPFMWSGLDMSQVWMPSELSRRSDWI